MPVSPVVSSDIMSSSDESPIGKSSLVASSSIVVPEFVSVGLEGSVLLFAGCDGSADEVPVVGPAVVEPEVVPDVDAVPDDVLLAGA